MHKPFLNKFLLATIASALLAPGLASAFDSSDLRSAVTLDGIRLHQLVLQDIADANGGNRSAGTAGLTESLDYLSAELTAAGYSVSLQPFDSSANLIAEFGGDGDRLVIVGAHIDSVANGPGIQDNGSGAATLLEIAIQMSALGIDPVNRVRFAWWGAQETSGNGARTHVLGLTPSERDAAIYLNLDMLGSPNFVRFVYDGDSSDSSTVNPPGSEKIESIFLDYFETHGLATAPSDFSEHPALPEFRAAGIPVGGLFGGAYGIKTEEEAATFGGVAGEQYDPCHHILCDTFDNISLQLLDEFSDAAAHAVLFFAQTTALRQGFDDLEAAVDALGLPSDNGLHAKLNAAIDAIERGNERAGANILRAFINAVEAMRQAGQLSDAEADNLVAEAQAIIDSLT